MQRDLEAVKNATILTTLFLAANLCNDEQCKQLGASLRLAADQIKDAVSAEGFDWPCDVAFVEQIADILEATAAPAAWVPRVISGGKLDIGTLLRTEPRR